MGRGSPSPGPAALSVRNGNAYLATLERIAESCLVKSLWKMENTLRMGSSGICKDVLGLIQGCGLVKDDPDPTRMTEDSASRGTHWQCSNVCL